MSDVNLKSIVFMPFKGNNGIDYFVIIVIFSSIIVFYNLKFYLASIYS